jgi:aldehyde:ferredoxin oxidoreductase
MVSCLFAREVYQPDLLAQCLASLGYSTLAENMNTVSSHIQRLRWKLRLATGFDPATAEIPKRFTEVATWKGPLDPHYLMALTEAYSKRIIELAKLDAHEVKK